MSRAILVAPVALDVRGIGEAWRVPDATNGTVQAWDTNRREVFEAAAHPEVLIFTRRQDLPAALRPFLFQVLRSDSATEALNPGFMRWADLGAGDYFRVRSAADVVSVKRKAQVVAGDRPLDWEPVHYWAGVLDDLGEANGF